jgi:hypothetical protein
MTKSGATSTSSNHMLLLKWAKINKEKEREAPFYYYILKKSDEFPSASLEFLDNSAPATISLPLTFLLPFLSASKTSFPILSLSLWLVFTKGYLLPSLRLLPSIAESVLHLHGRRNHLIELPRKTLVQNPCQTQI